MSLSKVVRQVQNPALGATLIWRYVVGHAKEAGHQQPCPLQHTFLVLPLLLHEDTYAHIASTQRVSGLRKFAEKFAATTNKQSDLLFAIHERSQHLRELSLESLQVGRASRLLNIELPTGLVVALTTETIKPPPPVPIQEMIRNAEKLGAWCARLSSREIAATLKVRF